MIAPKTRERLRVTVTTNGKRRFVPRDQVLLLSVVYGLLLLLKNKLFDASVFFKRIVLDSFHLLVYCPGKFST